MVSEVERYLDPSFVYRFTQGPEQVRSAEAARQDGLNCVALAHLALRDIFDEELPPELDCYEMYQDDERFPSVDAPTKLGDLVWFGLANPRVPLKDFVPRYDRTGDLLNWRDCALRHVAIGTGETQAGDPLLLHATHLGGTNTIWPMSEFARHRHYEQVYRVARLAQAPTLLVGA